MKGFHWKVFVISLVIVYAVAFLGSIFTTSSTNSAWYLNNKPAITPPNFVFPVVWNILFFLIALSLYTAWVYSKKTQKSKVAIIFGINLFLNFFWSFLFFKLQDPTCAFMDLGFLWLSILVMIFTTHEIRKSSSYLLIPYFLWVTFAGVLNYLWIV